MIHRISAAAYDFANLTTDNIERIEVFKRTHRALCMGPTLSGGVINIITKRGEGKLKAYFSAEGGSHYTAKEDGRYQWQFQTAPVCAV
jgi:vitamin B12 transporter